MVSLVWPGLSYSSFDDDAPDQRLAQATTRRAEIGLGSAHTACSIRRIAMADEDEPVEFDLALVAVLVEYGCETQSACSPDPALGDDLYW